MSAKRAARKATLPPLDHITYEDYDHVYEPSEDTFLLCDAVLLEQDYLRALHPCVAVEVGPGSGTVCTYLSALLTGHSADSARTAAGAPLLTLAVDVNPRACEVTLRTAAAAAAAATRPPGPPAPAPLRLECVAADLTLPLLPRLQHAVDILLFNPPYVCTPAEEVPSVSLGLGSGSGGTPLGAGIEAAWAGGPEGRLVTDRLLALLPRLLAWPHGVAYILLLQENDPAAVAAYLASLPACPCGCAGRRGGGQAGGGAGSLQGTIILSTRARNELLHVMKVTWVAEG